MNSSGCSLSLSNERKRFREKIALWFGASKRTPSGVPSGRSSTYTSILYRKMQTVSPVRHVWGSFNFRHNGDISRKQCVTVVDAWGTCGACDRCLGFGYRGMRRNTYSSRTSRETEALLDHLDQLGATCTPHLRRRSGPEFPFISHRLLYSAFTVCYF